MKNRKTNSRIVADNISTFKVKPAASLEDSATSGGDTSSKDAGAPELLRRRNARHRDSRTSLGRSVSGAIPTIGE